MSPCVLGTSFDPQVLVSSPKLQWKQKMSLGFSDFPPLLFPSSRISTEIFISLSFFFWQLDIVPRNMLWRVGTCYQLVLSSCRDPFLDKSCRDLALFEAFCICKVVVSNQILFVLLSLQVWLIPKIPLWIVPIFLSKWCFFFSFYSQHMVWLCVLVLKVLESTKQTPEFPPPKHVNLKP